MSKSVSNTVAIVVQRYGKDVVGGAEAHARILAEKLKNSLGYSVEVFTTTAKDYMTWANEYDPGTSEVDGITVHRFPVKTQRATLFGFYDRVIRRILRCSRRFRRLDFLSTGLEWLWIYFQGPVCPALVKTLHKNEGRYRKIIFFCYLYYPTLVASKGVEDKSILIPLAHDEPPFHFGIVRDLLRRMPRMIPNTEPEWDMIKRKLDPSRLPFSTPAGLGFDLSTPNKTDEIRSTIKDMVSGGDQFLLYLGRISAGKGVHELISWYQDWKQVEKSSQIKLVLAGHQESSVIIPDVSEISYLGFVSDAERDFLIQNCFALVNPSVYESLSMIVIEAIMAGKPVLARRQCKVFEFYARFAPSVRLFGDGCELGEELLRQLDIGSEESQRDIAISKSWAVARFSWDSILETFKLQVEG